MGVPVSGAMLIKFDLSSLTDAADIRRALVKFYVWDPGDKTDMRVWGFPLTTAWDESSVTLTQPAEGRTWSGEYFQPGADAGQPVAETIFNHDFSSDNHLNPPDEYVFDITSLVRDWVQGKMPNHGLALAPVNDWSIDRRISERYRLYASEQGGKYTPRLEVELAED